MKTFQIGCGKMSKYIMRYIYEKEGEVVGAVDINEDIIGKDIGSIMGLDDKGIIVSPLKELNNLLQESKPDVAIITTQSFLNDIEEVTRTCIKNGVNVLTTCEEAFYPENSNPLLFKELDTLAKANNVTVTGCGYQDIFWGNLITNLCATTQKITKIKGISSYNVEDYGIALALAHGAGFTTEEFNEKIASSNNMSEEEREELINSKNFFPSYMWNVVGWLADKLGLTIISINQECIPVMADEKINSDTLNMTIDEGVVRGMNAIVKCMTKENIEIEVECIGKVYKEDESDINDWTIYGEPTTNNLNTSPATVELTCADIVNRIPQIISMPSGFIPTSRYPEPKFITKF